MERSTVLVSIINVKIISEQANGILNGAHNTDAWMTGSRYRWIDSMYAWDCVLKQLASTALTHIKAHPDTSIRNLHSSLNGSNRFLSRIFLMTRTCSGGLFQVRRWLAGSWICLRETQAEAAWRGHNADPTLHYALLCNPVLILASASHLRLYIFFWQTAQGSSPSQSLHLHSCLWDCPSPSPKFYVHQSILK